MEATNQPTRWHDVPCPCGQGTIPGQLYEAGQRDCGNEANAYPLPGDPEPVACRHCARSVIPVFGDWMDGDGRFRCPSDWTEHAPMTAGAA